MKRLPVFSDIASDSPHKAHSQLSVLNVQLWLSMWNVAEVLAVQTLHIFTVSTHVYIAIVLCHETNRFFLTDDVMQNGRQCG